VIRDESLRSILLQKVMRDVPKAESNKYTHDLVMRLMSLVLEKVMRDVRYIAFLLTEAICAVSLIMFL